MKKTKAQKKKAKKKWRQKLNTRKNERKDLLRNCGIFIAHGLAPKG